jgi:hypothetical protein
MPEIPGLNKEPDPNQNKFTIVYPSKMEFVFAKWRLNMIKPSNTIKHRDHSAMNQNLGWLGYR